MKHCVAQYCARRFLAETIKRIYEGKVYILHYVREADGK